MSKKMNPDQVHASLQKFMLADGMEPVWNAGKSKGAYMYDDRKGRKILDLFSFFGTQPIGYNHPKMANDEFRNRIAKVSINRPTLSDIYTTEFAEFVEVFAKMTKRDTFKYWFFIEGGGMGVENALKAAFDWKVRKNMAAGRGEMGSKIIHFKEAFHGRTGYTLSLTNTSDPRKYQYFARFDWPRITNPKLSFPISEEILTKVRDTEEKALSEIKKALSDNPNDIAGLIIEPIQSEGGDNHFRSEFLQELRKLADENEFLLIFDEVQTGMGLTGKMWAFEHFGVKPDLVSFGKKAQIGGCMATDRIDEVKDHVFETSSRLNSTWGGNITDMVRCQRYLEIVEEENLIENAAKVGRIFLDKMTEWAASSDHISNVRGKGMLLAFDLPTPELRDAMWTRVFENGAAMLPCGDQSLRIRGHLDFRTQDVDAAMEIFKKSEKELNV